eukprot:Plantae.Rhodophyta-Purpureofilum_apyrenoidigerum.ctg23278.p1 GENE.Plantae.Rhodophyta-Purpureofilum_apyrenoidigerum.ctg23278~~Plantae.Rhodophyta-Purpureofilum_apyrenoidigerum.ctg23278.p1  ORF type:complete len:631 (-),score=125.80 Plantae.Rhodophyta-Purpureofilum_apyrenoidigerum.ctg23278:227-1948(-)
MDIAGSLTRVEKKERVRAEKRDRDLRVTRGKLLVQESMGEDEAQLRPHRFDDQVDRNVVRVIFSQHRTGITWRKHRSYLYAEHAQVEGEIVRLTGYLRGCSTDANRLAHVTGFGTFAVRRIVAARDPNSLFHRHESMQTDTVLSERDENADDVQSAAEVDPMAGEQTWPDEEDLGNNNAANESSQRRLRPKGWSEYQAAWIAEDDDYAVDEDDFTDVQSNKDIHEPADSDRAMDSELDNDNQSEGGNTDMNLSADEDEGIDEEEVKRLRARDEDVKFPDEVDVPVNKPARERFARYRGLKSLRTSPWDPKELLPREYATVHQFANFRATVKRLLKEEVNNYEAIVQVGSYVTFELEGISKDTAEQMTSSNRPLILCSLHKYENKRTVLHLGLNSTGSNVVRSKDPIIIETGFVRFEARPVFSEVNANCDKHKMERFLQPGRFCAATVFGPAIFPPSPAMAFNAEGSLIGTGSVLNADPDRIVLKRIVLTGYPFRINKRRAVVRFMFFNPEDIRWFKPVELWTKHGRSGHILEPLGTHGYMKCIFDGTVQHHDTVCMSLYKRVYPRLPDSKMTE